MLEILGSILKNTSSFALMAHLAYKELEEHDVPYIFYGLSISIHILTLHAYHFICEIEK